MDVSRNTVVSAVVQRCNISRSCDTESMFFFPILFWMAVIQWAANSRLLEIFSSIECPWLLTVSGCKQLVQCLSQHIHYKGVGRLPLPVEFLLGLRSRKKKHDQIIQVNNFLIGVRNNLYSQTTRDFVETANWEGIVFRHTFRLRSSDYQRFRAQWVLTIKQTRLSSYRVKQSRLGNSTQLDRL